MAAQTSGASTGECRRRLAAAMTRRRPRLLVAALGTVGAIGLVGAPPVGAVPAAERCEDETHLWVGDALLDAPGARLDTGLAVPAATAGVELTVVGASADGIDAAGRARPLSVYVGEVRASAGAPVDGGAVTAVHEVDSSGPLRLVGVTVVVRRCTLVASIVVPTITAPPAAPVAPVAPVVAPVVVAPVVVAPARGMLPETGDEPWGRSLVGASLVALGCAMVSFGRRRDVAAGAAGADQLTAGAPEPGSPHVAAPHATR